MREGPCGRVAVVACLNHPRGRSAKAAAAKAAFENYPNAPQRDEPAKELRLKLLGSNVLIGEERMKKSPIKFKSLRTRFRPIARRTVEAQLRCRRLL